MRINEKSEKGPRTEKKYGSMSKTHFAGVRLFIVKKNKFAVTLGLNRKPAQLSTEAIKGRKWKKQVLLTVPVLVTIVPLHKELTS